MTNKHKWLNLSMSKLLNQGSTRDHASNPKSSNAITSLTHLLFNFLVAHPSYPLLSTYSSQYTSLQQWHRLASRISSRLSTHGSHKLPLCLLTSTISFPFHITFCQTHKSLWEISWSTCRIFQAIRENMENTISPGKNPAHVLTPLSQRPHHHIYNQTPPSLCQFLQVLNLGEDPMVYKRPCQPQEIWPPTRVEIP